MRRPRAGHAGRLAAARPPSYQAWTHAQTARVHVVADEGGDLVFK
jgi:hypothetical protein